MSEQDHNMPKVIVQPEQIVATTEGTRLFSTAYIRDDVTPDQARHIVADAQGVDPAAIEIGTKEEMLRRHSGSEAGRLSVGFTKWNSSWDPHAPVDPNLN